MSNRLIYILAMVLLFFQSQAYSQGVLTFVAAHDPNTLDSVLAQTYDEAYVFMNTLEGIAQVDESLQVSPALAESWQVSEDQLVYTFRLRKGLKWSDGKPLTADDFIYAWQRLLEPKVNSPYNYLLFNITGAKEYASGVEKDFKKVGITSTSQSEIQVRLKRRTSYFLSLLSFWPSFPQRRDLHLAYPDSWFLPEHSVSIGPYQLKEWRKGVSLKFVVNPHYYGKKPTITRVTALIGEGHEPESDIILSFSTADFVRLSSQGAGFNLKKFPYLCLHYLGFNLNSPRFVDRNLRRAVATVLDQKKVTEDVQRGDRVADSLVPVGLGGYDPTAAIPFNMAALKEITLPKIDPKAEFVLLTRDGRSLDAAESIRRALMSKLNLNVRVLAVTPSQFKEHLVRGDMDMFIGAWGSDYPDAASFAEIFRSDNGHNYVGFKNSTFDHLTENAADVNDAGERAEYYKVAQRILIRDEVAIVPLYFPLLGILVKNTVSQVYINPLNHFLFKNVIMR